MRNFLSKIIYIVFIAAIISYQCTFLCFAENYSSLNSSVISNNEAMRIQNCIEEIKYNSINDTSSTYDISKKLDSDELTDMFYISSYDISSGYKTYQLDNLIIQEYEQEKSFQKLMTDNYFYRIPFQNKIGLSGVISINKDSSTYLGMESTLSNEEVATIDIKNIYNTINESDISNKITELKFTYSPMYCAEFVLVLCDSEEYVIPVFYNLNANEIGIDNYKIYSVNNFFSLMSNAFDEQFCVENPDSSMGVPLKKSNNSTTFNCNVLIKLSIIFLILSIFVSFIRRKVDLADHCSN